MCMYIYIYICVCIYIYIEYIYTYTYICDDMIIYYILYVYLVLCTVVEFETPTRVTSPSSAKVHFQPRPQHGPVASCGSLHGFEF